MCQYTFPLYLLEGGTVVGVLKQGMKPIKTYWIPCGRCTPCRLTKTCQWAIRNVHEASLHEHSVFLTLTYAPEHLPKDGSLDHRHFQLFMKRLRKKYKVPLQFYMCGEYGDKSGRAHYHALIYGLEVKDRKFLKSTNAGFNLDTSKELDKIWGLGHVFIGEVTFESAAYVARYIMKKITGGTCEYKEGKACMCKHFHYLVKPEYTKMSLKRPIGKEWYNRFKNDVYPHDYVESRGKKTRPPRYYDKLYSKESPIDFDELKALREHRASLRAMDNTPERLVVKEEILEINLKKLKRDSFI